MKDTEFKALKPTDKQYSVADGDGLSMLVKPNGSKLWRYRYRFNEKQQILSIGVYPDVSLADARVKATDAKSVLKSGINPSTAKKEAKVLVKAKKIATVHTLEILTRKILDDRYSSKEISEAHYKRTITALENDIYPTLGSLHIADVTIEDIASAIGAIADRGAVESSKKLFYAISKIYRTLITRDLKNKGIQKYNLTSNPCDNIDIAELVGNSKPQNYATITDDKGIKALLLNIDAYSGDYVTVMALKILSHTFLRSFNIRHAEWSEIDFKDKLWRIDKSKMKRKQDFIVPLSHQVLTLLIELHKVSGDGKYLFPSTKSKNTPFSDGAILGAVRRMGYTTNEFTPHGFRSMFSTIANEKSKFGLEVIDTQLAHTVGNKVSQAYNRAKYLDERVELMQWWSDYLDDVKTMEVTR